MPEPKPTNSARSIDRPWHALDAETTLEQLNSNANGLSDAEARERLHDTSIEVARTVAVNTLVMFEIFYLLNARYLLEPSLTPEGLSGNRFVYIAIAVLFAFQIAFTYLPPMQTLFGTAGLDVLAWARVIVVAMSVLILVEIEKAIFRRLRRRRTQH